MKKVFGSGFCGLWYIEEPWFEILPNELREQEDKFEWKADNPMYPNNLYPYKDGIKLQYDEEV